MVFIYGFLFYFNPYSLIVWFGSKNNIDEKELKKIYTRNKNISSYMRRLKIYLTYITLIAYSNMLNIYF